MSVESVSSGAGIDPVIIEDEIRVPPIIQHRMIAIHELAFEAIRVMGIEHAIASRVTIIYDLDSITPELHVEMKDEVIAINVPLLYLMRSEDLTTDTSEWFKQVIQKKGKLSEKDIVSLKACYQFLQHSKLSEEAKKFVLYHEVAHIANKDFLSPPKNNRESREREQKADLGAAKYSNAARGAIYLFEIMSKFITSEQTTHPSFQARIDYLRPWSFDDLPEKSA